MKATKPILHGRDHVPGGADPVPGMLPGTSSDYPGFVRGKASLLGYWRLGETSPGPFADSSGVGEPADATRTTPGAVAPTYHVTGALTDNDDGAWQQNHAGTFGGPSANTQSDWFVTAASVDSKHNFASGESYSVVVWVKPFASTSVFQGGIIGRVATVAGTPDFEGGWILKMSWPDLILVWERGTQADGVKTVASPSGLAPDTWAFVAATHDGAAHTLNLYINGTLVATGSAGTGDIPYLNLGALDLGSGYMDAVLGTPAGAAAYQGSFYGVLDEAATFQGALTLEEVQQLYAAALSGGGPGDVLGIGDDGNPAWQPPGVEVEHGGGVPEENPVTTPGFAYAGFPANPSGWHYAAHTETAVLYDSAPGRFDVPSMKWVRTPFDTVRIQRRWELTVGGSFRDAWLPDDRGLTEHARDGLLHITADMVSDTVKHIINGFFAIEYPVLDYQGLPDFTGGGITAPDDYTRAGRVLNASTGVVLRRLPGSAQRRFMQWEWFNDADGMAVSVLYTVDNPYPLYPAWPERPLTLPQPYPQLSPTDSLAYYTTPAGNPGFNDGTFELEQNLVAGDNLCLQAWQDSPWLLRFSTDHFPNYTPFPTVEVWRRRPFLAVTYTYDPDSVDHATGRLL
jgi:hypothetical protein